VSGFSGLRGPERHCLVCDLTPPPQLVEHSDQPVHGPQWPLGVRERLLAARWALTISWICEHREKRDL
jgi:hypothetical protein